MIEKEGREGRRERREKKGERERERLIVCVEEGGERECMHIPQRIQRSGNNLQELTLFTIWVPGVELRSPGLATSPFTL